MIEFEFDLEFQFFIYFSLRIISVFHLQFGDHLIFCVELQSDLDYAFEFDLDFHSQFEFDYACLMNFLSELQILFEFGVFRSRACVSIRV